MAGIEEVLEATETLFPRAVRQDELDHFLGYIAKELPGEVDCQISYGRRYGSNGTASNAYSLNVSGRIRDAQTPLAFDSFELSPYGSGNPEEVASLKFFSIPGHDLEEHRSEVRDLWKAVRGIVTDYFEKFPVTLPS